MARMHRLSTVVAAGLLLLATGCGGSGDGDGADRPSTGELATAIQEGGENGMFGDTGAKLDQDAADCMAKALHDSKISDEALQAIVDGDEDYEASKADEDAASSVVVEVQKCAASLME
jgi:hypothetical protein